MSKKVSFSIIAVGLLCAMVWVFFAYRSAIAISLWHRLHQERLATFIAPENAELSFLIAEYYFNQGGYDLNKSLHYYSRALTLRPQYLDALYQRGRVYFIQGQFADALFDIRAVLHLNPEFKQGYYMYGLINGYSDNLHDAIYGFSEFIRRDDFNWAGYNDLAWIYFKQGDYQNTLDTVALGLTKAPNNPWLNNIYGVALMNLGRKEEAKSALLKALEASKQLTPSDWGKSYPGNDPRVYATGLEETRSVIRHNLALLEQ